SHVHFFDSTVPPTPPTYTLSLHDALPISPSPTRFLPPGRHRCGRGRAASGVQPAPSDRSAALPPAPGRASASSRACECQRWVGSDRKSTRLNSSHVKISYAVFCLKKKKV